MLFHLWGIAAARLVPWAIVTGAVIPWAVVPWAFVTGTIIPWAVKTRAIVATRLIVAGWTRGRFGGFNQARVTVADVINQIMGRDHWLIIACDVAKLWAVIGAVIGAVVTPLFAALIVPLIARWHACLSSSSVVLRDKWQ